MSDATAAGSEGLESGRAFVTTQWDRVWLARDGGSPEAERALEDLCRAYWPPLYTFVRRSGHEPAEAQDLTQAFFERLLERNYLAHLRHQRGRFRSFLLTFLKHFLSEQRNRARAQKRGGDRVVLSMDALAEEDRHLADLAGPLSPDRAYELRWAETLLTRAVERLTAEYAAAGQAPLFDALKDFQPHDPSGRSYAAIGKELGMSEVAVKSAAQRLRRRHREVLREEIARTVSDPAAVDEEIRYLRQVLTGGPG